MKADIKQPYFINSARPPKCDVRQVTTSGKLSVPTISIILLYFVFYFFICIEYGHDYTPLGGS